VVVKMGWKIIPTVLGSIAIFASVIIIISVVNSSPLPFPAGWSPESRAQLAFGISALAIIAIIIFIYRISKGNFSDLIKDEKKYPSLALFQFLVWTLIISFAYFGIYLTRLFGGELGLPDEIPDNILILMGISVGVPVLNVKVSEKKYANVPSADAPSAPYTLRRRPSTLLSMLQENGQLSLTRFQMFVWTWIGIIIYLFLLYFTVNTEMDNVTQLSLPNVDGTIVFLMGLSQAAYLGKKISEIK
jgi:hypothetical protein